MSELHPFSDYLISKMGNEDLEIREKTCKFISVCGS
jgi:hypothetical protein